MKNLFTLLFALMASVGTLFAQSGTCGQNLTWNLVDGVLTISGSGDMTSWEDTYYVSWYEYRNSINTVIIEDGVTSIGKWAFGNCINVTKVTIPNGVTRIENWAFGGCNITSLIIPNGVTSIGNYVFYRCENMVSISIPNSLESIGNNTFSGCSGLLSIDIPDHVTSIGNYAFEYCNGLTSFTIPKSVISIGKYAFRDCSKLASFDVAADNPNYSSKDGVLFNKDQTLLIKYPTGCSRTSYTIPNSVTSIAARAFENCYSLMSITIPSGVTDIGDEAFDGAYNISSITNYSVTPQVISANTFTQLAACTLYVPAESIEAYKAADVWKDLGTIKAIDTPTPCIIASGTCGANLTWELSCDSVLTISGTGDMTNWSASVSVPWYNYLDNIAYLSLPDGLTSIGQLAFCLCKALTSVTIPNTVTSIGRSAFDQCSGLTSVTIPNSVTSIGDDVFYLCKGLTSPIYTSKIFAFLPYSYSGSYSIPDGIESIVGGAFEYRSSLTSVSIPNSVTNIGQRAFAECNRLLSIDVASDNPNYCSVDGVLFNKDKTIIIQFPGGKQGAYTIPNSVKRVEDFAFGDCYFLSSVEIPNSVTSIGNAGFRACNSLSSLTIGNSVTSIGDYAFIHCRQLTSVTNYAIVPQTINSTVFYNVDLSAITLYVTAESLEAYQNADVWKDFGTILAIGDEVEPQYATIADTYNMAADSVFTLGAFDVVYITGVNDGHVYIKDATGSGMIYQTNFGLQVGDHVEAGMEGKISIYHGSHEIVPISAKENLTITHGEAPAPIEATEVPSLTNINQYVVYKNVSFSKDTAFVSSKRHGVYAVWNNQNILFYNQYYISATLKADKKYNITAVNTIYNTTLEAYPLAVEEVNTPAPCIIDSGTYRKTITWELSCDSVLTIGGTGAISVFFTIPWASLSGSVKSVVVRDGVTSIYGFRNYPNLTSVTLGDSVTQITNYAFKNCTALTSIEIPNSVTSIGQHAFDSCLSLVSIEIPSSVTSIGQHAFDSCYALTSVTINSNEVTSHSNLKTIFGDQVTTYIIGDDVTSILNGAFYECTNLSSVSIGNGVTSIGDAAFYNCTNLSSINLPNSVTSIGQNAFVNCYAITSIEIPNSVTSIGQNAFVNCYAITSIEIPNSVTSIGGAAFAGCTGLYSIDVAKDNPNYCSVDGVLFTKDKTILLQYPAGKTDKSYSIPNSVSGFGAYVFYGCSALTSVEIPNSVTSIEEAAFAGSIGLNSIDVAIDNPNYCSVDGVLFTKDLTILLHYPASKTDKSYSVPDGVTRIGQQAFGLCSALNSVEIPNSVTTIGPWTFESCTELSTITCRAVNPPALEENCFGYLDLSAITLYVPAESIEAYRTADVWKKFGTILSIQAEEVTETITEVGTEPQDNGVIVTWPVSSEAVTYTLEIRKNGELICTLSFNAQGQLIGIAFAPDRNGNHHAPAALMTSNGGLRFTVTGLESGTNYHLDVQAKDAEDKAIVSYSVDFKTTGQAPIITDIDHVPGGQAYSTKLLRDGQVFILRGDKTYTLQGQEVK